MRCPGQLSVFFEPMMQKYKVRITLRDCKPSVSASSFALSRPYCSSARASAARAPSHAMPCRIGLTSTSNGRPSGRAHRRSRRILRRHPRSVVIYEARRLPEVLWILRHVIDRSRGKGRFLPSGLHTQLSCAGLRDPGRPCGASRIDTVSCGGVGRHQTFRRALVLGRFSGRSTLCGIAVRAVNGSGHTFTFLERDLPSLGIGLPARRLRALWTMLTHVHGNLLNISDLARSLTVSIPYHRGDLDVLEGAYMIRRLQPYDSRSCGANVQKRLTKSAKISPRDSGLLHFLAGLREPRELTTWPRRTRRSRAWSSRSLRHSPCVSWFGPSFSFGGHRPGPRSIY